MILVPLLLMFGGYLAFSIILFFFPTILHKRMKFKLECIEEALAGQRILRVAHRGGSRLATQNTIEAFKKAEPLCDMLEMDVCVTKDGVLVVHHDDNLSRTCGSQEHVKDFNYEDLPPFKEEIQLNFAREDHKMKTNNQKIPTLEEVFKTFPNVPMNIEIKTPTKPAIKEFVRLINQYNRRNLTIVGIRGPMQQDLREADLNGLRFMNDSNFFQLLVLLVTGLLPFVYIQEATLQVPLFTEEFYQWKIREWGNHWKTHAFFSGIRLLNFLLRPLVSHLRKRGIMTMYWVCNDQDDYKRAIDNGACCVMTDDPVRLNQFLKNRDPKEETLQVQQPEKKAQ